MASASATFPCPTRTSRPLRGGLSQPWPEDRWDNRELGRKRPRADRCSCAQRGLREDRGWLLHSLGLKSDGTIVAWGDDSYGQCNVPVPNADFVAVAAVGHHSLGMKADGTVVAWGDDSYGQCNVPGPNADFVAVAGGWGHSLGLKFDGRIVAWDGTNSASATFPCPTRTSWPWPGAGVTVWAWDLPGQSWLGGTTATASATSLCPTRISRPWLGRLLQPGLRSDGTIVAWGTTALASARPRRRTRTTWPWRRATSIACVCSPTGELWPGGTTGMASVTFPCPTRTSRPLRGGGITALA